MAYLSFTKTRTLTASVVTFTADSTFCQLINGMVSSMTTMNNNIASLQSQINGFQDTYQSKVNKDDCPGFLADKFQSSDTIEMKLVPGGTADCQKIEFNVKTVSTGPTPTPIGFDPCETPWTAIANYEVLDGHKLLPGTGIPNQTWQGDVKWGIDKIGKVGLKGKCTINNCNFSFLQTGGGSASSITQKVFTIPTNACTDAKLANSDDYYGFNALAKSKLPYAGGKIGLYIYRIGLEIWVKMENYEITTQQAYYDFELQFGALKALN